MNVAAVEPLSNCEDAERSAARGDFTVCQLLHSMRLGGAEVLAARIARNLRDKYRFVFVCLDELGTLGMQLQSEGFSIQVLGRKPGVDWRSIRRLASILRQERVDLIHAHQYTPFFYGIAARLLCRHPSVLFTEHGRHFPDYRRWKRVIANRLLLERRDNVVGVGGVVRQALIANEGFSAETVGVIYNGIDLRPYTDGTTDRSTVRAEWGVDADEIVILQVARFDYLKDHATALRMMKLLEPAVPRCRVVFVGDGTEMEKAREMVRELGLERRVSFLGMRTDVPRLWRGADICLLTSISEGIPLTLIEAMAAGVPIVATDVGGVSEVVENGVSGLLAPRGNAEALASAILQLARDTDLRLRLSRAGLSRAHAQFSEEQMHASYRDLFDAVRNRIQR